MTIWKVATTHKKMCEEREEWFHRERDWTIKRINGYRWGTFTVETNDGEPPEDIDPENPDGINMYDYFSADIMYENYKYGLPLNLAIGDRLYWLSTGAYTTSYSAVEFNGFPPLKSFYV